MTDQYGTIISKNFTVALTNVNETPTTMTAGDFNGDGKADILGQNAAGLPLIALMNGADVISVSVLSNVGPTWDAKAVADFNGDGKADILWQNDSGLPAIWTMNGNTGQPLFDAGRGQ